MGLKSGQPAPDFFLKDQNGAVVRLSDFKGKPLVLYFYPKDDTPGCTAEACTFRDSFEVFTDAGAAVVGISSDSPESHKQFAKKNKLPFKLLSDEDESVKKAYGVYTMMGLWSGRVTFVIDGKGVVRHVFSSQFQPKKHVDEALEVLKHL
ncbi:MAG TPA: peroxiredoxin [bacterium]|nr:peroxiredoxin [bacterium]